MSVSGAGEETPVKVASLACQLQEPLLLNLLVEELHQYRICAVTGEERCAATLEQHQRGADQVEQRLAAELQSSMAQEEICASDFRQYRQSAAATEQHLALELRATTSAEEQCAEALWAIEEEEVQAQTRRLDEASFAKEDVVAILRVELSAESAALRRAYHRTEEQQWRHQAFMENAERQAVRAEVEMQELRVALDEKDGVLEQLVAEERWAFAAYEARLRDELDAEREELCSNLRTHLSGLVPAGFSPPPRISARSPSTARLG